jgi:aryl-alcohol dehydrogenase-like predicted oxidoreductase
MRFRRLGTSGLQVSVVGLGCNNFGSRIDEAQAARVVDAAVDGGITLFDTADVYGNGQSEELLGRALRGRRQQVIIATKFFHAMGEGPSMRGASRGYIVRAVDASLKRLGTDYIDLYQQHVYDEETPIEETLSALTDLVRQGKVRYIGSSNFAAWKIADAEWVARTHHVERFISAQNSYSLINRDVEDEVIPACAAYGIGILPYLPLSGGMLTGKYRRNQAAPEGSKFAKNERARDRYFTDENFTRVESLERFATERGISLLDVAIGGLAAKPQIGSVIAGATRPEQVDANIAAGEWTPSANELSEIDRLTA